MPGRRTALIGALVALTIAATAMGCGGGDEDDRQEIDARIGALQTAFDARDAQRVCRDMTERAKLLIAFMAHHISSSCPAAVRRVRRWMARGDRAVIGRAPRTTAVDVDGRTATATVERPGDPPYSVRLAAAGGRWKLNGVFDAGSSTFQEFSDVPPDSGPHPEPVADEDGDPVTAFTVAGDTRRPCPPVRTDGPGGVAGGCKVSVPWSKNMDMSVLNLFGRMPLAKCGLHLTLHVDASGRTWTDDFHVGGPTACGDIRGCGSNLTNSRHRTWHGRIEQGPGGRLRHQFLDLCLDTCVGEYRGDWMVGMERHERGWRLRSDRAMVGSTGWLFDGTMDSAPAAIELAER